MYNKTGRIIAGIIIGFIFGTIYFLWPARCLITGPMPSEGLFIDPDLNWAIIKNSFAWGGTAGVIIGFLGGTGVSPTLPRGHMSKAISCMSFLVCTILVFIVHGSNLLHMSGGRIGITFFYELVLFFSTILLGDALSFIEALGE
jgi:hypothetical protein